MNESLASTHAGGFPAAREGGTGESMLPAEPIRIAPADDAPAGAGATAGGGICEPSSGGSTRGTTAGTHASPATPLPVTIIPSRVPTNPYASLLADAVTAAGAELVETGGLSWNWLNRNRGRVKVVHLHWLHIFYRREGEPLGSAVHALLFAGLLVWARLLGYRLIWTMHNAQPHDSPTPLADRIARLAAMNLAEVVIHCEAGRRLLRGRKLLGGVHAIPHGSYRGVYPDTITRDEARRRLDLTDDQVVFVAFGLIRGYKGLERLIDAFTTLAAEEQAEAQDEAQAGVQTGAQDGRRPVLLVVGRPREAADRDMVDALRRRAREADIRWILEFVPDESVQLYMRAADFAVAAFENILVSGSAILALSFGTPLVAPRLGGLPELLTGGAGILYDPPDGLLEALRIAVTSDPAPMAAAAEARAIALDWNAIGAAHLRLYRGGAA